MRQSKYLYWFGICVGLLSKYQAIFLWLAAIVFFIRYDRKQFLSIHFYLSGLVSLLIFSPIILWDLSSVFSGLNYHASRVYRAEDSLFWLHGILHILFEAGYQNPITFVVLCIGLFMVLSTSWYRQQTIYFLICTSLPLIGIVWVMSFLSQETLPHWTGVAYIGLMLIAAYVIVRGEHSQRLAKRIVLSRKMARTSLGLMVIMGIAMIAFQIAVRNGYTIEADKNNIRMNENNFGVDMQVWENVEHVLQTYLDSQNITQPILVVDGWLLASRLDYYVAVPLGIPLFVVGDNHQYRKVNRERIKQLDITDKTSFYFASTSNYYKEVPQALRGDSSLAPIKIPVQMEGKLCLYLYLTPIVDARKSLSWITE